MAYFIPISTRFLLAAGLLVCGSLRAQTPDIGAAAKLLSFTGRISVMRDSTPWALNAGDLVQPQQMVITGDDGWGVFQVSDGSKFEVYPNSRVVFRANRSEWRDILEVWLGKIRVQIEHFGTVPNNNRVHTPSAVISVRGTVFDITVDDADGTTLIEDEEGSVAVLHLLRQGPAKILYPGDSLRVYKNEPLAKAGFDKGGAVQRTLRAAADAFYQLGIGSRPGGAAPRIPSTTSSPADKNGGTPPPPAPPPPPPSAPPAAPPH